MAEMKRQQIKIFKNIPGSLTLDFRDAENPQNQLQFSIGANDKFKRITLRYAVTMFELDNTMTAFEKGYFGVDKKDMELILEYAEELGIYVDEKYIGNLKEEDTSQKYSEAQIASFLKLGRYKEVKAIIEGNSKPAKQALLEAAKNNVDELNLKMVNIVEDGLKISITGDE